MAALERLSQEDKARFEYLGASCHSLEDAKTAQALGAHYIILGNIFETDCKKGLPGRGLEFLREVCRETELPVYAVGGINAVSYTHLEAPSYAKIRQVYQAHGIYCEPLNLGSRGIPTAELQRSKARILHITPFNSYPSYVTADASKRREYLKWASERGLSLIHI